MLFRHEYRGGVWVDLEQPSEEDVRRVAEEFPISKRVEKEILSLTPSALAEADADTALLILHFPAHGAEDGDTKNQEVDFIVGDGFILTVRYEVVAPIHHLKKLLEARELVAAQDALTTGILLELLFAHLYTSVRDHASHIANRLERIEKDMFDGHERATVRAISNVNREFLHLDAATASQEEPLGRFLKELSVREPFGPAFAERAARILTERSRVARVIATHRAVAAELRETNGILLETRQNEVMKTLTIINFVFLPLGLVSWIFSMRTEGMPLIDSPNAFWLVLALMLGIALLLVAFFAKKRWLF